MNHVTENMGFVQIFFEKYILLRWQNKMLKSFDAKFVKMIFKNECQQH